MKTTKNVQREKGVEGSLEIYYRRFVRSQVLALEEYLPGESGLDPEQIKLSANESDFGVAPAVYKALKAGLASNFPVNRYPDSSCSALREALSHEFGLPADWFIAGNGLDDIITMLALTFLNPDDDVVLPAMSFSVYESVTRMQGATPKAIPMKADLSIDVEAMSEAVDSRTKMLFLCNPNNPTGTIVRTREFNDLVERLSTLPQAPLLIVDQAYIDYLDPHEDYLNAINYVKDHHNVVVLRTFSKISALAGLRVGYAIAHPDLLSYIYRVRQPYTVNALAQLAALTDVRDPSVRAFKDKVKRSVRSSRKKLEKCLADEGIPYVPSYANFVFAMHNLPYEKLGRMAARFEEKGVLVRKLHYEKAPAGLRLSIGTPKENARLIEVIRELKPEYDAAAANIPSSA